MILDGRTQRFIGECLDPPQDGVVNAPAETRHVLVAHAEGHKRRLIKIEGKAATSTMLVPIVDRCGAPDENRSNNVSSAR